MKSEMFVMYFNIFFKNESDLNGYVETFFKSLSYVKNYNSDSYVFLESSAIITIWLTFDFENLENLLEDISNNLPLVKQKSIDMGGVGFNIVYNTKAQFKLSYKTLQTFKNLFGDYSISLDALDKNWTSDSRAYYQKEYYQLFINFKNFNNENNILEQSLSLIYKYNNLVKVEMVQLENFECYLLLSMKYIKKKFKVDEQFSDVLKLFENKSNSLELIFGIYQQNRSDLTGGETGFEIINKLLINKADLLISFGTSPYFIR